MHIHLKHNIQISPIWYKNVAVKVYYFMFSCNIFFLYWITQQQDSFGDVVSYRVFVLSWKNSALNEQIFYILMVSLKTSWVSDLNYKDTYRKITIIWKDTQCLEEEFVPKICLCFYFTRWQNIIVLKLFILCILIKLFIIKLHIWPSLCWLFV